MEVWDPDSSAALGMLRKNILPMNCDWLQGEKWMGKKEKNKLDISFDKNLERSCL